MSFHNTQREGEVLGCRCPGCLTLVVRRNEVPLTSPRPVKSVEASGTKSNACCCCTEVLNGPTVDEARVRSRN
jgi:hypothetical protein